MISRFLGALQFLTLLPIRRSTASPGDSAIFFPLVGALLGALAAAVLYVASAPLGPSIAALLAIAVLLLATGGLHEDGLTDAADAFRAGRSRDKIFEILKDSRIGTYGALALIISMLLRWQSLTRFKKYPLAGLAAALALSRASMVLLSAGAPSAGDGLGALFARQISRRAVWAAVAQATMFTVLMGYLIGWKPAVVMIAADFSIVQLARAYFVRRLGGINGDCLGATCQIVETMNLIVIAWQPFY
jgi:adenosylcobinamide-GDP ribazoletransferase